tara:strand:- start:39 stop:695 length:657 start_codon:yes stop_codon:yes gene_type:complete
MGYEFHWEVISNYWTWIAKGVGLTLYISIVAMFFALTTGLLVALLRISKSLPLALFGRAYIEFFRAIPLLVFIIWFYYGLAMATGINFQPIMAGIICLTMQHAGYLAEIYRSGIQAVPKGQWEAAYSLGYSPARTFIKIIAPQAFKIVIPPTANQGVSMIKDSALVSVIGVNELMRQSQIATSNTFRPFEFYTVAALIYVALAIGLSQLAKLTEDRMK